MDAFLKAYSIALLSSMSHTNLEVGIEIIVDYINQLFLIVRILSFFFFFNFQILPSAWGIPILPLLHLAPSHLSFRILQSQFNA